MCVCVGWGGGEEGGVQEVDGKEKGQYHVLTATET